MANLNDLKVVRTIELRATTSGIDQATRELGGLDTAQKNVSKSGEAMASVTETSARRQLSVAGSYDRLRQQIDGGYAATVRFDRAQRTLDKAHSQGITSIGEHNRMLEMARARYIGAGVANDNLTKAIGLQGHEWKNLGFQVNDAVTMLLSGSSAMQVVGTQGGQVLQILQGAEGGVAGALKSIGSAAAALITPTTAVVAVIGAAAGAAVIGAKAGWDYAESQDAAARALNGVGRLSGASVAGINAAATASADAAKVSIGSAREMVTTFAATGKIGQTLFGDLTVTASRYAKTAGIELPDATSKLAGALVDPVAGALELNKTLGFLSGRTLEVIERQTAMGDRAGAQRTVLDAMKGSLVGVTDQTNAWALAYDAVARASKNAYDATGRTVMSIVAPSPEQQLNQRLAELERARTAVMQGGNVNAGDPEHLRFMQSQGYTPEMIRRELTPSAPGSTVEPSIAIAEGRVRELEDEIRELNEKIMWAKINAQLGQREAEINSITLKAKDIIAQITPTTTDLLRLTTFRTELEKALGTGQAPTGTTEALERINRLIRDGGTEAHGLRIAAQDAFDQAPLLAYDRSLAQINARYREYIKNANGDEKVISGLRAAQALEVGTLITQSQRNPLRDAGLRLDEQVAGLRVQKDSLFATSEAAATMAAKQELLNGFIRQNVPITAEMSKGIDDLAARMGKAAAANEEFQRVRSNIVQGMDELRSGSRGLLTGIFSDARQGRNPLESLKNGLGSIADRLVDRVVSKPLIENMLGFDGKAGGGMFGDMVSKIFGSTSGMATANMTVTAANVVVNGGVGAGAGALGIPGASSQAVTSGSGSGSLTAPLSSSRSLVTDGSGRVLSYGGSDANGLPITVQPNGSALVSAGRSGYDTLAATRDANPIIRNVELPAARRELYDSVAARDYSNFGDSGVVRPDLVAGMGPELLKRAQSLRTSTDSAATSMTAMTDAAAQIPSGTDAATSGLSNLFSSLSNLKLPGGSGLSGIFGIGGAEASTGVGYAYGGWTGPGGKYTAAGIVHANEYVIPSETVSRLGASYFDQYLPGYASGGYVSSGPAVVAVPSASAAPIVNNNVHNYAGARVETKESRGPNGEINIDTIVRDVERAQSDRMGKGRGSLGPAVDARSRGNAAMRVG